eukprot:1792150-Amphidinium_carterae.1
MSIAFTVLLKSWQRSEQQCLMPNIDWSSPRVGTLSACVRSTSPTSKRRCCWRAASIGSTG